MKVGDTIYSVRLVGETPQFREHTIVKYAKKRMIVREKSVGVEGWYGSHTLDIAAFTKNGYLVRPLSGIFAPTKEAALIALIESCERERAGHERAVIRCGRQIKALKAELRKLPEQTEDVEAI